MLIFKVAKFVLKHPLLTHGARQLVHKKLRPPKEASPMKQKVRGHAFRLVAVSYTHLDVYKRQVQPQADGH